MYAVAAMKRDFHSVSNFSPGSQIRIQSLKGSNATQRYGPQQASEAKRPYLHAGRWLKTGEIVVIVRRPAEAY